LERIERAEAIIRTHGFDALQNDYVLTDALLHNLLIASEAVTDSATSCVMGTKSSISPSCAEISTT
jgi:uncharacterized protein YutE (UPF0331/DUF86 family)